MQNKSRNWTDVQLIISSISIAITLGFWSLTASREKTGASVLGTALTSTQTDPGAMGAAPVTLLPGQTILLGSATATATSASVAQVQPKRRNDRGGGGSGGSKGGGGHASTKSS